MEYALLLQQQTAESMLDSCIPIVIITQDTPNAYKDTVFTFFGWVTLRDLHSDSANPLILIYLHGLLYAQLSSDESQTDIEWVAQTTNAYDRMKHTT
jgi:hypothetical protein